MMKRLSFFWCGCTIIIATLVFSVNCGILYKSDKGNEYFIETESQFQYTWFEAIYQCSRRNMSLIAIETEEKQREIVQILRIARDVYRYYPSKLWIGGIGTGFGNYVWVTTGTKFNYTNWSEGEPDRENDDQQCAALHAKRMSWFIRKCSVKRGLICEENHLLKAKNQDLSVAKESCAEKLRVLEARQTSQIEMFYRDNDMLKLNHEHEKKILLEKLAKCNK